MEMMEINGIEIKLGMERGGGEESAGAIIRWGPREASCTWHRYEGEVSYQVGRTGEGKGWDGKGRKRVVVKSLSLPLFLSFPRYKPYQL